MAISQQWTVSSSLGYLELDQNQVWFSEPKLEPISDFFVKNWSWNWIPSSIYL